MVLGVLELDLNKLVPPSKTPEKCSLKMMDDQDVVALNKLDISKSLFAQKSVRGWWPCVFEKDGLKVLGVSLNTEYTETLSKDLLHQSNIKC